jgi:hypothetical protein
MMGELSGLLPVMQYKKILGISKFSSREQFTVDQRPTLAIKNYIYIFQKSN